MFKSLILLMCNENVCWNAQDVRVWNYDIEYMLSYIVQDYDNHALHEIPNLLYYGLLILVLYSRMSCLVSFLLSIPSVLVPKNLVLFLETVSFFTILLFNTWSLEFSQSHDSGKLSKFSIGQVLSNLSNLSNLRNPIISLLRNISQKSSELSLVQLSSTISNWLVQSSLVFIKMGVGFSNE